MRKKHVKFARIFLKSNLRLFTGLLMLPASWYFFVNLPSVFNDWIKSPSYLSGKLNSIYSLDKLRFILELRGENLNVSRVFFNKVTLLVNNLSDFLTYISPKYYFADNTVFSKVEAIPFFFFPFWIFGILISIKERNFRLILLFIVFSFIAFILDQKNLFFLFPSTLVSLLIINGGVGYLFKGRLSKYSWFFLTWVVYDLFLLGVLLT